MSLRTLLLFIALIKNPTPFFSGDSELFRQKNILGDAGRRSQIENENRESFPIGTATH